MRQRAPSGLERMPNLPDGSMWYRAFRWWTTPEDARRALARADAICNRPSDLRELLRRTDVPRAVK